MGGWVWTTWSPASPAHFYIPLGWIPVSPARSDSWLLWPPDRPKVIPITLATSTGLPDRAHVASCHGKYDGICNDTLDGL